MGAWDSIGAEQIRSAPSLDSRCSRVRKYVSRMQLTPNLLGSQLKLARNWLSRVKKRVP